MLKATNASLRSRRIVMLGVAVAMLGAWLMALVGPDVTAPVIDEPPTTADAPTVAVGLTEPDSLARLERAGLPLPVPDVDQLSARARADELQPGQADGPHVTVEPMIWLALAVFVVIVLEAAALVAVVARDKPSLAPARVRMFTGGRGMDVLVKAAASVGAPAGAPPPPGKQTSQRPVAADDRLSAAVEQRSGWGAVAEQVQAQLGGDLSRLLELADRIEFSRGHLVRQVRAAARPARFAAAALSALVPGAVVARALTDPGYLPRLAADAASLEVASGVLLAVAGAWWLHRLSRPPFSPLPAVRRGYEREHVNGYRLGDVLDRAALCAEAGLDVEHALAHATRAEPLGPGPQLARLVSGAGTDRLEDLWAVQRDTLVGRCAQALVRWLEDQATAPEALERSAARLRLEQEWTVWRRADGWPTAFILPVVLCNLPAVVILLFAVS